MDQNSNREIIIDDMGISLITIRIHNPFRSPPRASIIARHSRSRAKNIKIVKAQPGTVDVSSTIIPLNNTTQPSRLRPERFPFLDFFQPSQQIPKSRLAFLKHRLES
jgi:hypothetical protein